MPARILVIEDNPANLELITYLLRAFGHITAAAITGEEGLSAACHDPPHLILCDVHLPGMDGCEVARRLKAHPLTRGIPVVAVTALAMVGDRERILAAGFDAYIPKPIDPESFVRQVESCLAAPLAENPPERRPRLTHAVRILMVDDSPVDAVLARAILEPLGHQVLSARDAGEGLDAARRDPPDLILSDVQVGCGNGLNLLAEVRADTRLRHIPFVFISSSAGSGSTLNDRRFRQADGHLTRPLAARALLGMVEGCLQERKRNDGYDPGH